MESVRVNEEEGFTFPGEFGWNLTQSRLVIYMLIKCNSLLKAIAFYKYYIYNVIAFMRHTVQQVPWAKISIGGRTE